MVSLLGRHVIELIRVRCNEYAVLDKTVIDIFAFKNSDSVVRSLCTCGKCKLISTISTWKFQGRGSYFVFVLGIQLSITQLAVIHHALRDGIGQHGLDDIAII